ncbi:MAG TPA: hypothetical protein VIR31_01745, partial [Nitrososphaeraceae archaeon]
MAIRSTTLHPGRSMLRSFTRQKHQNERNFLRTRVSRQGILVDQSHWYMSVPSSSMTTDKAATSTIAR